MSNREKELSMESSSPKEIFNIGLDFLRRNNIPSSNGDIETIK